MKGFWARLFGRRETDPDDPGFSRHESFEDRQSDEFVEEHLGGIDPNRLLPDESPPPDD